MLLLNGQISLLTKFRCITPQMELASSPSGKMLEMQMRKYPLASIGCSPEILHQRISFLWRGIPQAFRIPSGPKEVTAPPLLLFRMCALRIGVNIFLDTSLYGAPRNISIKSARNSELHDSVGILLVSSINRVANQNGSSTISASAGTA